MKMYEEVDTYIHIILSLALVGCECSASLTGHLTAGERVPSTLDRKLVEFQTQSGNMKGLNLFTIWDSSSDLGFLPIPSHYSDCANAAPADRVKEKIYLEVNVNP
jgi:hypothetical protein